MSAAAGGALLVGCGGPAPQQGGGGGALNSEELAKLLPAYSPVEYAKPDLPGVNGSKAGYLKFPSTLVDAVKEKPLSGGEVTVMTPTFWPVPPGLGQNSYYDAVNERLGGTVKFELVAGADYAQKLAAMMAGRQVPELTVMPTFTVPPRFSAGVGEVFRDIGGLIAGDKAKDYPMLAGIPTAVWENCVYNGKLFAVPFPGDLFAEATFYRPELFQSLGVDPQVKSFAELKDLCAKVNDPAGNRWAVGDIFRTLVRARGDKGDWQRDSSGKVVNHIETPEYAAAIRDMRELFDAGYVHPDVVAGNFSRLKELFASGQVLLHQDGVGAWHETLEQQRPVNPDFRMSAILPFASDGGKATYPISNPVSMLTLFRKDLSDDRVRELLRLCNFAAAPFGTSEHFLLRYGIEGKHSTRNAEGSPQLNALGAKEITLTYGFISGPAEAYAHTQFPDFVREAHAWHADAYSKQVKPITFGLRIEEPAELTKLGKQFEDRTNDILRGRASAKDADGLAEEWRKAGGDKLREFYDKVLTDAGR
ncbi:extracellular solute-binding protein [Actinosynnema pretiosum]|uniref:ABC transporter substrate-binding protein n=1 Tax=Actinosynnema pretiosum TaxID=42197 RepID=A0A290Z416_9PSEU|nr:extracellular solute-binding protein [Actinosynnema pretiosum]ATE53770.1 ABC transporter substrate-binding protein [Actinosynnema pretiosum]